MSSRANLYLQNSRLPVKSPQGFSHAYLRGFLFGAGLTF